jgi:hypothetical protein
MSERSDVFVKSWVGRNVHNVPGAEDYRGEVERLCVASVAEAQEAGIDADELDETVGDVEDYMTDAYEGVIDYELGFKD